MKKLNQLLAFVVLVSVSLSFVVPNNLNLDTPTNTSIQNVAPKFDSSTSFGDTLEFVELNRMLKKELLNKIETCFEQFNPDIFMTKCYTRVEFRLESSYLNSVLYKNEEIRGTIYLIDCSYPHRIADLSINFSEKSIMVKESYRTPEVKHREFIKDFCAFLSPFPKRK
jgi:hypothetical protein